MPLHCFYAVAVCVPVHAEDLKAIDWQILLLLGGGISLGTIVRFSGLLDLLVSELSTISDNAYTMFLLFNFIVMVRACL